MVEVDKLLYSAGINIGDLRSDIKQAEALFHEMGNEAQNVFGKQIGNELGRAFDPKKVKAPLSDIRRQLAVFGEDAVKQFDRTFGRAQAKKMFDPFRDESKTFFGQLKQSMRSGFDIKSIALGTAAGFGAVELGKQLLQAGADAVKFSAEFERALVQVQTIAEEDFDISNVRDQIKSLASEIPQDVLTLTQGLNDIVGSGAFDSTEKAIEALRVAAKSATAGATDTQTASQSLIFVMNAFKATGITAEQTADILFRTVDEGVISFSQLASNIGEVAAPAALAGISLEEVGAAVATMTRGGISASETMTALKNMIGDIVAPTKGAKEAAKEFGIDFSRAGLQAAGGLKEFVAQIKEATGGDPEKLKKLFPDERALKAIQQIGGVSAQVFQDLSATFLNTGETAGAMDRAFQLVNKTAEEQYQLFKNNLSNAVLGLGDSLLKGLAPALQSVNEWMTSLGRTDLENTIASLRKLGVESERLKFLEMRSAAENAKEEIASLEQQFNVLTNNISTFGKSSGIPLLDTRAYREGAKDIADTFQQIITSTQGATLAQQRLIELDKEFAQVELRITEAKQGREQLSKGELQSLNEQREYLIGQRETLVDLLGVGAKIAAQKEIIKKSEDEISGKNKEQTQQAEQTAAAVVQVAAAEKAVTAEKKKQVDAVLKIRDSIGAPLPSIRDNRLNSLDVKLVLKPIEYDFEAVRAKIAQERRDARDHAMQLFGEIAGTFDDFLVQMDRTGIRVNRTLFDLSALIYDGVNGFLPAFTKFKDVLGNTDAKFLDKFAAGFSAVSIGAGIALPLMKGFLEGFGLFGKRSQEMLRIDEIQRESMEKQREAAEAMRKSIEEMRQSLRESSLERINAQLRETEEQIRAITGGIVDLSLADIARVEELTGIVAELERQISEAEDRGDLDLAGRLREDLAPFLEELDRFGFRTSNFTAAQLENLKLLAEKSDELRKALEGFGGFADNFGGMMEKLRAQFELFDIEDVTEKFKLFGEEIKKRFGVDLPVSMEGIDEFVRKGFEAFEQGGEALAAFLTSMGLGDMSAGTFWEFLSTLEQFGDEMGKEGDRLDDTTDEIVDKFSKLMSRLELEFDLFNVDDPVEQFRRMREDIFAQFNAVIPMTEEGIAAFIKAGFTALGQGEDAVKALLAQLDLEELTADTFQDLLRRLAGYAREAKEVIDDVKEDSREERVTGIVRQITFTEANELIDEVSTIREVVTQMLDLARDPAYNPMAGHYDLMGDYLTENNLLARQQLTELIQIKLAVRQLVQAPSAVSGGATNVLLFGGTNSAQAPAGSLSPQELAKYRDAVSRARGRGIV